MSEIPPLGQSQPALARIAARKAAQAQQQAQTPRGSDRVEVSTAARLLSQLHQVPEVREDLVAEVRAQIEQGTYETPEKIDITIDKLLNDLNA
jgi:negative regulator of flagellin synthesis FlgM